MVKRRFGFSCVERGTWQELKDDLRDHRPWIFSGQRFCDWALETTLERAVPDAAIRSATEARLLSDYMRVAKNYLRPSMIPQTPVDWLGSMQHHGAPTRLLDFTRSPYVAVYFAVEDSLPDDTAAVWALHEPWARDRAETVMKRAAVGEPDQRRNHLEGWLSGIPEQGGVRLVAPVGLMEMSDRQVAQQSVFLLAGDLSASFLDNLRELDAPSDPLRDHFKCFLVPGAWRREILTDLRFMNISRATLFPGLDGFARSLYYSLAQETNVEWTARVRARRDARIRARLKGDSSA